MKTRIAVTSLGCNKNLVDTEVMLAHLKSAGCILVDEPGEADCLLINTCSFLTDAVEESLDRIVELAQLKGEGGPGRLVVTGCLVSRYGDEILKEIPEVDALVRPTHLDSVVEAIQGGERSTEGRVAEKATSDAKRQTSNAELQTSNPDFPFPPRILSWPPHRAYLKIGEGCSNRCSYCLIPSIRGAFVSRDRDSLLAEMKYLIQSGVREVTLVAQDSGRYGSDQGAGSLPDLMESLQSVSGDYWLRVLYVHPERVSDSLLSTMGSDPRICRYLDIPFQHISARILHRMGRGDSPAPMEVVQKVRARLPGVSLRTTLMTGFPGETDRDFEMLLDFLECARIEHLGVFAYSREEGTAAGAMDDQVDPGLARERAGILMKEQARVSSEKLAESVGKEMTVIVEDNDEDGPFGRHQGQAPEVDGVVRLDREAERGSFVQVRITGSDVYDLEGEVADSDPENPSA
jgi:ribosomal protein S12 methylthiotransferase